MQGRRTIIRTDGATRHGGRYRQQPWNRQAPHVADSQQSATCRRWAVDRPTRVAPRNRSRRARARSAPRTTASTSFPVIPPCLRDLLGALRVTLWPLCALFFGWPLRLLSSRFHDPNLLAVADRIGRIGHDTLVLNDPAGDFNRGSEVAHNTYVLQDDTVIRPDCGDLRLGIAVEHRAGRNGESVRVRRNPKMHAR